MPLSIVAMSCGGTVVVDGLNTDLDDGLSGGPGDGECLLFIPPSTTAPVFSKPECFPEPFSGCPATNAAFAQIKNVESCFDVKSVDCGPVRQSGDCCYMATVAQASLPYCGGVPGRAFTVGSAALVAARVRADRGWRAPLSSAAAQDELSFADLSSEAREALAAAWEADGLFEHASIASFARVSLELLSVGAPASLVAAAHEAALDEIRHARLCFALAERYRGEPVAPGPFPFGGAVAVSNDLSAIAVAAAREGCIGETIAAALASEELDHASDPVVRSALATIADDEARHAELAWRTVAFAIERGGQEVRAKVARVFAEAERYFPAPTPVPSVPEAVLAAHGRLTAERMMRAVQKTFDEVIRPCAHALLQSSPPTREGSSISAA